MELPPYQFYRRNNTEKLATERIELHANFNVLRLSSIKVEPFDLKNSFSLEIQLEPSVEPFPINVNFSDLSVNEATQTILFSLSMPSFRDVKMPRGRKHIRFRVIPTTTRDFEITLGLHYINIA